MPVGTKMWWKAAILGIAALLVAQGWALELSYEDSIHALASGNVASLQGNSKGEVWLNITGFAPDKLPYVQHDVGMWSMDNADALVVIAGLAKTAASMGKWGDVVFLYNAFSMNAHVEYAKVSSEQMHDGLFAAVTGKNHSGPDMALIKLYTSTSSSIDLSEAFDNLKKSESKVAELWTAAFCSNLNTAATSACQALLNAVHFDVTVKTGGPRDLCYQGCCISWSANATFQVENLYNAANYCISACASTTVSCEVRGVSLQGKIVNQCLSNRPGGCT